MFLQGSLQKTAPYLSRNPQKFLTFLKKGFAILDIISAPESWFPGKDYIIKENWNVLFAP